MAQAAISRGLFYLTQQYKEFKHNIMSYYSSTSYAKHESFEFFLKKNDHSHFTTGVEKIVVFNRITSSK